VTQASLVGCYGTRCQTDVAINDDVAVTCRFVPPCVARCGSSPRSNDGQTIRGPIIFAMIRPVTWAFLPGWRDLNPRPLRPEVNSCGYGRVRHQFAWRRQTVQLGAFLRCVVATTPTLLPSPGQAAGPGPSVVAGTVSGRHSAVAGLAAYLARILAQSVPRRTELAQVRRRQRQG
jgi:hypothetical protein